MKHANKRIVFILIIISTATCLVGCKQPFVKEEHIEDYGTAISCILSAVVPSFESCFYETKEKDNYVFRFSSSTFPETSEGKVYINATTGAVEKVVTDGISAANLLRRKSDYVYDESQAQIQLEHLNSFANQVVLSARIGFITPIASEDFFGTRYSELTGFILFAAIADSRANADILMGYNTNWNLQYGMSWEILSLEMNRLRLARKNARISDSISTVFFPIEYLEEIQWRFAYRKGETDRYRILAKQLLYKLTNDENCEIGPDYPSFGPSSRNSNRIIGIDVLMPKRALQSLLQTDNNMYITKQNKAF